MLSFSSRSLLSLSSAVIAAFLSMALVDVGCDSTVTPPIDDIDMDYSLTPASKVTVLNGTHSVVFDSLGWISQGKWDPTTPHIEIIHHTFYSGIWLYSDLDKPRANAYFAPYQSNFHRDMKDEEPLGIFVLTNDSLIAPVTNWPTNYGAPSTLNGQPLLLGDMMAWGFFTAHAPDPAEPRYHDALFQDPIVGLDLGISVYMFDDSDVENLLFVRFDVINNTVETISDLYVGYHSDTDLNARTGNTGCNVANATGYDETLALSYTYHTQSKTGDPAPDYCFGVLSGYMFLQSPLNGTSRDQVLAHTIIRKNTDFNYRGFDESSYTEPRHIGMALKGLSTSGDPMIDPSSGLETKFAFTGDPVVGTGWLDTPQDIRSLLSLKPFTILPGETKSITVVWIIVAEANLEDGLTILKAQAELIQKFHDQYLN